MSTSTILSIFQSLLPRRRAITGHDIGNCIRLSDMTDTTWTSAYEGDGVVYRSSKMSTKAALGYATSLNDTFSISVQRSAGDEPDRGFMSEDEDPFWAHEEPRVIITADDFNEAEGTRKIQEWLAKGHQITHEV